MGRSSTPRAERGPRGRTGFACFSDGKRLEEAKYHAARARQREGSVAVACPPWVVPCPCSARATCVSTPKPAQARSIGALPDVRETVRIAWWRWRRRRGARTKGAVAGRRARF